MNIYYLTMDYCCEKLIDCSRSTRVFFFIFFVMLMGNSCSNQKENKKQKSIVEVSHDKNSVKEKHDKKQKDPCEVLPVWNLDAGQKTNQGGYYNHFKGGDATIKIGFSSRERRGNGGYSQKITYNKKDSGYCGVWFHLYDEKKVAGDRYLDISSFPYLSFWVKGEKGAEDVRVQMADPLWLDREDSRPAGQTSIYLEQGITQEWQEIIIPFDDFELEADKASSFVLNFTSVGEGIIYIDDIYFKSHPHCKIPFSESSPITEAGSSTSTMKNNRIMWVWDVVSLLQKPAYRREFFAFSQKHRITEIFLQIPYHFLNDKTPQVICVLEHPTELRNLIKEMRKNGILVHALDGYPEFALADHHPRVISQIRALLDFNQNAHPDERFYGIHLDNEPYQLAGFYGKEVKNILTDYLILNQKIMDLLRAEKSTIVYGVDIPFWFDEAKEKDGSLKYSISYRGKIKNVAEHMLDIVDNIGVMSYRNFPGGADGVIRHAEEEVEYGSKIGKEVYVGVETFRYDDQEVYFIPSSQKRIENYLASRFESFSIRVIQEDSYHLIGLVRPLAPEKEKAFHKALLAMYQDFDESEKMLTSEDDASSIVWMINGKLEYKDATIHLLEGQGKKKKIAFRTQAVMQEKITFSGKTKTELEEALSGVQRAFQGKKGFRGIAIHYYKTYKDMEE